MCALFLFWKSQCWGELGQLTNPLPNEQDELQDTERQFLVKFIKWVGEGMMHSRWW